MTIEEKNLIYQELITLSTALGSAPDVHRLKIYVNELSEYDFLSVHATLKKMRTTVKFFPQLCEIIDIMKTGGVSSQDLGVLIASEIVESARRFGYYRMGDAKKFLGEKWVVVERFGGWRELCFTDQSHQQSLRAQLRDCAIACVNQAKTTAKGFIGLAQNSGKMGLLSHGEADENNR